MVSIATPVASTAPMPTYINVALIPLIFLSTLPDPGSRLLPRRVLNRTSDRIATGPARSALPMGFRAPQLETRPGAFLVHVSEARTLPDAPSVV